MADHDHDEHGGGKTSGGGHHSGGAHAGGGHEEGHEGAPEWLISFADNVMLIMAFFVIMLAMNMKERTTGGIGGKDQGSAENDRMIEFAIALREAFNNPVDPESADPSEAALVRFIRQKRSMQGSADSDGPPGKDREVQNPRPSDFYTQGGTVAFSERSSTLGASARETAAKIAQRLQGQRWIVEVRGHASPYETFQKPDEGMRLSYDRALAVATVLVDNGMKWEQLRLVQCGDSDRVVVRPGDRASDTPNRRVDVIVTQETVAPDPYSSEKSGSR